MVVLVIIGRHMVLQARKAYEEDLEAQGADANLLDEVEVDEKVGLVDLVRGDILADVGIVEENEKGSKRCAGRVRLYTSLSRWKTLLLPRQTPHLWDIQVVKMTETSWMLPSSQSSRRAPLLTK